MCDREDVFMHIVPRTGSLHLVKKSEHACKKNLVAVEVYSGAKMCE